MKGKVCQWKDDKGFGFIQPDDGSEKLFFHVSSVKTNARRPQVGDTVLYDGWNLRFAPAPDNGVIRYVRLDVRTQRRTVGEKLNTPEVRHDRNYCY